MPPESDAVARPEPVDPAVLRAHIDTTPTTPRSQQPRFTPASCAQQLESEVWLLRLGSPGVTQLNVLPQFVKGLPSHFAYHPFRFVDFKEQARVRKQAGQRYAVCTTE